jgi:hypothetical protein
MTKPMDIEEVAEAVEMLEAFDTSLPSVEKIDYFQDGIQLLNDYLADNPETPHATFINNIKARHTRRLLQFLTTIDSSNMLSWFKVIGALLEAREELEKLYATYPGLKSDYDRFVAEWSETPEFKRIIDGILKEKE